MVLMRGLAALAAVALIGAVAAAGCGGLSQSDADVRCNLEQQGDSACFDASVYAICQSCFERCGDSCQLQDGTCPAIYQCPGDGPFDAGPDGL
jgi:anaerobic selenocysteine-containing dehydrogenase